MQSDGLTAVLRNVCSTTYKALGPYVHAYSVHRRQIMAGAAPPVDVPTVLHYL